MKKLLFIITSILIIPPVAMYTFSTTKQTLNNPATITTISDPQVLGATDNSEQIYFTVNIPATFKQNLSAPNVVYSVNGETGDIEIDNSLVAGDGIEVKGRKISNTGILTLVAGTGITVDGNTITNDGIVSLSAGTGIEIDGSTITNTYTFTPDYTQSGWTDNGSSVVLTTTTDTVTVGTLTTGAITASSLTVDGLSVLSGNATIGNGVAVLPSVDLGSDLGSSSFRFNNLWVANINSNSSQSFSGQTTFSYPPQDTTLSEASVLINPTTSTADGQLLGLAIAGYQKALIDEDGDITIGYSDATSAPASDYPLNVYGHSGTRVSFVDTSGNAYFGGNVGIGTTNPTSKLYVSGNAASGQIVAYIENPGVGRTLALEGGGEGWLSFRNTSGIEIGRILNTSIGGTGNVVHIEGAEGVALGRAGQYSLFASGSQVKLNLLGSATTPSLSFVSDTNTGLFSSGADAINITTGGVERLRVDSSGNVGIGTTGPTYKFSIGSTDATDQIGIYHDNNNAYFKTTDGNFTFQSAEGTDSNTNLMIIPNGSGDSFLQLTEQPSGSTLNLLAGVGSGQIYTTSGILHLQTDANNSIRFFQSATEGETTELQIHGYRTGDANRSLQIGVGTDADDTASFDGVSNYYFDGKIFLPDGDNTTPTIFSSTNTDSGFYTATGGETGMIGGSSGQNYIGINGSGVYSNVSINSPNGTSSFPSFSFTNDSDTGLYRTYDAGGAIGIISDATEIVRIGQKGLNVMSGNLGIGTSSPGARLHVVGTSFPQIVIANDSTDNAIKYGMFGVTQYDVDEEPMAVFFGNPNNTTNILHIGGGASQMNAATELALYTAPNNTTTTGTSKLVINSAGNILINGFTSSTVGQTIKAAPSQTANLSEWQDSSGNILSVVDKNGNIGIGTTNPTSPLTVGNSSATGPLITLDTYTNNQQILFKRAGADFGNITVGDGPKMEIKTTYTGAKLILKSAAQIYFTTGGSNTDRLGISSTGGVGIGSTYSSNDTIANNLIVEGNIGIGTTTPGEKLEVTGNIKTSSLTTGTVYSNSGVLTNTDPSDRNLKHNILTLEDGTLNKLMGLRAVSFNWNNTGDGALGFIAQEVGEVFPELVGSNSDGTLGLYTTQFIPVLAKAIQEQQLEIDEIALSTASADLSIYATISDTNDLLDIINNFKTQIANTITSITGYFEEIFTDKSHQKELCIGEFDDETCLNKSQIDQLIELLPSPTPEAELEINPPSTPESSATPTPSLSPSPDPEATGSAEL